MASGTARFNSAERNYAARFNCANWHIRLSIFTEAFSYELPKIFQHYSIFMFYGSNNTLCVFFMWWTIRQIMLYMYISLNKYILVLVNNWFFFCVIKYFKTVSFVSFLKVNFIDFFFIQLSISYVEEGEVLQSEKLISYILS